MKKLSLLIVYGLFYSINSLNAKISLTNNLSFSKSVFDKRTGKWYLTTEADAAQSLVSVGPLSGSSPISTTSHSFEDDIELGRIIYNIALGYKPNGDPYITLSGNGLTLIVKDITEKKELVDTTVTLNGGAQVNGVIRSMTMTNAMKKKNDNTNYNFIISGVSTSGQSFLSNDSSGLSLTQITEDLDTPLVNKGTIAFGAGSTWVAANQGAITPAARPGIVKWNNDLQRLFVGIAGTTHAPNAAANTLITLSCFKLDADFTTLDNVPMNSTLNGYDTGAAAATSSIIGVTSEAAVAMSINYFDIMHTSTNRYYAIVNGGLGNISVSSIKVFAIPLVGPEGDNPGTLATVHDATIPIINFNSRATGITQLFHETDTPAIVGASSLPCPDAVNINPFAIDGIASPVLVRQLEAVGDTVYCATSMTNDANNQSGLYYSQALFNSSGAITGWTEWALATPSQLSGLSNTDSSCTAFAIDAARGKIWTIPALNTNVINTTQWTHQTDPTTFAGQINTQLEGPCYCHLVLDQYAENVGNKIRGRFALFGGNGKVVAIRTGFANNASYTATNKPTDTWDDATVAAVSLSEGLPSTPINCLGYSYLSEEDEDRRNFFLAGTNSGLYIYTFKDTDLSGFAINTDNILSAMDHNQCIFTRGKWTNFAITEPVLKITTTTPGLISVLVKGVNGHHVAEISIGGSLTGNTGDEFLFDRYLYEQDILDDYGITDMYDILAVRKNNNSTLLTATDQGIIGSRLPLSLAHKTILHHFSTPQRTRGNSMFWFAKRSNDVTTGNITQKTRLYQATVDYINADDLSTTNTNPISLVPAHPITTDIHTFTLSNDGDADRHNNLHILHSVTTPVYSNGSLRFFGMRVFNNQDIYSKLVILPYRTHTLECNITGLIDITDADLQDVKSIYWINNVGAGYAMIGTDKGLLSLE